jgi:hypothetical protein
MVHSEPSHIVEGGIFISHIHEDARAAEALDEFLKAKLPFLADRTFVSSNLTDLILGDDWLQKIKIALESSRIVIALLSPESVNRPWVNFEAGAAWLHPDKTLIPVCIGDLNPGSVPKPYSNIQGIRLGPYAHEADMIVSEAPWYLLHSIRKIMGESGLTPMFSPFDRTLTELNRSLIQWENASRRLPEVTRHEETDVS